MERTGRIAYVLVLTAQNLHGRSDLRTFTDGRFSHDAITADIDSGADARFRMGKESAKRNPARHVTLSQGQVIIGNTKIVAKATGYCRTGVSEKCVNGLDAAEARQRGKRPRRNEK